MMNIKRKCPHNSDGNVYKEMLGQYNIAVGVSECRGMPPAIDKGFNLKLKSHWASVCLTVSRLTCIRLPWLASAPQQQC